MIALFPNPAEMKETGGVFAWSSSRTVFFDPALVSVAPFFFNLLKTKMDAKPGAQADIVFVKDGALAQEAYRLSVRKNRVQITAACHTGAFYAVQTLRQLGSFDVAIPSSIPCVEINDAPCFGWRGLSLDESRHFFGMVEVKRLLDLMSMHKLNMFHWHLTDDQGWRIEIKKYPLLTELGSKRVGSQCKGWGSTYVDDIPVEGFYTQEQIEEVVQYAADRGITIVPEIDMPAHFAAALAGYPWLACRELPCEVMNYCGGAVPEKIHGIMDWNRPACPGKESVYEFIFQVIDEVVALFPSGYFHIGGDECPKDEWKKCPHCAAAMKQHGLKDEEELQGYFNNRIEQYLKQKQVRLIGWNEILKANNLSDSIIAQYWTDTRDKNVETHLNNGGKVVMSKHQSFYFDMTYARYPLKNTYQFNPLSGNIRKESLSNVLGVEGEVWTEFIADRAKLDLSVFPRMEALAEVAWTPENKRNWRHFLKRLHAFLPTLDALGVGYATDKVFTPRWRHKAKILQLFSNGDPCFEVKLNEALKAGQKKI